MRKFVLPGPNVQTVRLLCLVALLSATAAFAKHKHAVEASAQNKQVTYDGRSLMVNGKRELLFSGSIHYPRSTPEVM